MEIEKTDRELVIGTSKYELEYLEKWIPRLQKKI